MAIRPARPRLPRSDRTSSLKSWGRDFGRQASFLNSNSTLMSTARPSLLKRIVNWTGRIVAVVFLLSVLLVTAYTLFPVPFTPLMVIRAGESVLQGKSPIWNRDWVSLDEVSEKMQLAVIAAEDARFFDHSGFDFEAIEKALTFNQKSTRRMRGGSTITQQVAKNVFLWPARSWFRKGAEAYLTVLIELLWSKRRIMEVYLNVVEFGDGVYGVEAASQKYFHKPASKLNGSEAALLASVLPNPRRFLVTKPSGYVRFRQSMIQRRSRNVSLPTAN